MPLAADYCGNISWTANRIVMVWRQTTYVILMTGMKDKVLACGLIYFIYFCFLLLGA